MNKPKFKVGDIIVAKETLNPFFTKGKKYTITRLYEDTRGFHPYYIKNSGYEGWSDKDYFKLFKRAKITDWRAELG